MKYLKMLGLMALSLTALLAAFAGSASATELTSPKGTVYKGTLNAQGSVTFDGPTQVRCNNSTWEAEIENQGAAVTVSGKLKNLTFAECGNATLSVINPGTFEIHTDTESANGNGTMTSTGATITSLLHYAFVGTIHCITETSNTTFATIEGSINTGKTAGAETLPVPDPTDAFCAEEVIWTSSYSITKPDYLDID